MARTCQLVITPEWKSRLEEAGLASMEGIYGRAEGRTVTRSGSTQVLRVVLPGDPAEETVYIKKYWFATARRRWRGMFRETFFGTSKARREFENLRRLRAWEIDAPPAVAYGEERRGGWLFRSFLISAGVPEPTGLDTYMAHVLPRLSGEEQRRARRTVLLSLADQTRKMHSFSFVHHDYFWRNILLSGTCLRRFFLIDAHKGRRWKPGADDVGRQAIDLAALDAPAPWYWSRTDRLRFLLRYRNETKLSPAGKILARRTLKLAEPERARQLKRVQNAPPPERTRPTNRNVS